MIVRFGKRVYDVTPLENMRLLVFFQNGVIKKVELRSIFNELESRYLPLLQNEEVFTKVGVQPGGYGICWGEQLNLASERLYKEGKTIPLSQKDFLEFVHCQVINASEAAELLSCSRQNINDLVLRQKLHPVKQTAKNTLFYKREIEQRKWQ